MKITKVAPASSAAEKKARRVAGAEKAAATRKANTEADKLQAKAESARVKKAATVKGNKKATPVTKSKAKVQAKAPVKKASRAKSTRATRADLTQFPNFEVEEWNQKSFSNNLPGVRVGIPSPDFMYPRTQVVLELQPMRAYIYI